MKKTVIKGIGFLLIFVSSAALYKMCNGNALYLIPAIMLGLGFTLIQIDNF